MTERVLKHLTARWATVDTAALRSGFALLARGMPVSAREIAEIAVIPEARARQALASERVGKDGDDRLVELFGVSMVPAACRARFELEERTRELYTCCALVAVMLPRLVGRPAEISAQDPETLERLKLRVDTQRIVQAPPAMMATLVETDEQTLQANMGESFCRHVRFFASAASAARFAGKDPRRRVVPLDELFALGRDLYRKVWNGQRERSSG